MARMRARDAIRFMPRRSGNRCARRPAPGRAGRQETAAVGHRGRRRVTLIESPLAASLAWPGPAPMASPPRASNTLSWLRSAQSVVSSARLIPAVNVTTSYRYRRRPRSARSIITLALRWYCSMITSRPVSRSPLLPGILRSRWPGPRLSPAPSALFAPRSERDANAMKTGCECRVSVAYYAGPAECRVRCGQEPAWLALGEET
jgi:hypothetical protein